MIHAAPFLLRLKQRLDTTTLDLVIAFRERDLTWHLVLDVFRSARGDLPLLCPFRHALKLNSISSSAPVFRLGIRGPLSAQLKQTSTAASMAATPSHKQRVSLKTAADPEPQVDKLLALYIESRAIMLKISLCQRMRSMAAFQIPPACPQCLKDRPLALHHRIARSGSP